MNADEPKMLLAIQFQVNLFLPTYDLLCSTYLAPRDIVLSVLVLAILVLVRMCHC